VSRAIECSVAWAGAAEQRRWTLQLPEGATVAEALQAARLLDAASGAELPDVPWDTAPVGVFGIACARSAVLADGDRVELYRPLQIDPKDARRQRAGRTRSR
jgi:putative ubiquitin-RnfH superfamily antitoxin RatB of RatAB toxin-antitoxin module